MSLFSSTRANTSCLSLVIFSAKILVTMLPSFLLRYSGFTSSIPTAPYSSWNSQATGRPSSVSINTDWKLVIRYWIHFSLLVKGHDLCTISVWMSVSSDIWNPSGIGLEKKMGSYVNYKSKLSSYIWIQIINSVQRFLNDK